MVDTVNIEGFFLRTNMFDEICAIILQRLNSADDPAGAQPEWGLESSYDAFIAGNHKRKIAISKPVSGWVAGIESKEVVDFALLQHIGLSLAVDVIVYQISDSTGGCGHAVFSDGHVVETHFNDEASDPLAETRAIIRDFGIPFDVVMFREIAQAKSGNWRIMQKA
jgi:hypothetical protein